MKQDQSTVSMIHMFTHAVFQVENGVVTDVNTAARQLAIAPGISITELLNTGRDEYDTFRGGALSLTLSIQGCNYISTVLRSGNCNIFHLHSNYAADDLRSMALTAQCIREPLAGIMSISDQLADLPSQHTPEISQRAFLSRNANRILRILNNMHDAVSVRDRTYNMEVLNLPSVLTEIVDAASALTEETGKTIHYTALQERIYTICDRDMLERAFYNLLSNAIKYSPEGSAIEISVTKSGNRILLTVKNPCDHTLSSELGTIFFRYRREPGLEDGRQGIGLGIPMVCAAAAAHKGTLMLTQDPENNVQFSMSVAIISDHTNLRSPLSHIDYAGGHNHALLELSDVLPTRIYQ